MRVRPHRLTAVLVAGLLLVTLLVTGTAGLFLYHARRHIGADYTGFATEAVRAQLSVQRLELAAEAFVDNPVPATRQELRQAIWLLEHRRETLAHGLATTDLPEPRADRLGRVLASLGPDLATLGRRVDAAGSTPQAAGRIRKRVGDLEGRLAYVFSELQGVVMDASAAQRRLMGRLALALVALGALLLLMLSGLIVAVSKLHGQRQALQRLSVTDQLTGLPNRRAISQRAQSVVAQARRSGRPLSLAVMDIDHFKRINDRLGHPAGDRVLTAIGDLLPGIVREADVVARMGGEEFAVLMPDTDEEAANALCERLRRRVATLHEDHSGELPAITTSIGLASAAGANADFEGLYARADHALYAAKAAGRDRVSAAASPPPDRTAMANP